MKILIKNGHIVDPANQIDEVKDILIDGDKISKVTKSIKSQADKTIDARDKIVMPGIIDMHVHLREPGREDKETIASATAAALAGGVTSLLAMPNTRPAIDCAENIQILKELIKKSAKANVFIAGTITKKRKGEELSDISALKREGPLAITDDGSSVDNENLLLEALKRSKEERLLLISHCEDKSLSKSGMVNLGVISTVLGLRGISKESEFERVKRDIELTRKADASIHIAHVSCAESVDIIAIAKKEGVRVTAEAAPHHFALDETQLMDYNTNLKMNPPLRSKEDVEALKQGLKSGVIDVIASDHAPHTENEKDIEFDRAEFGTIGLETILAVSITELIETGLLDWPKLVERLCLNPAKILGINRGTLAEGAVADIAIVDPKREWIVKRENFHSKSKNSCFIGCKFKGKVECTIYGGEIVYENANYR